VHHPITQILYNEFGQKIVGFLYFNKHKSQRAIAKEMGIHRATVKELSSKEDRRETWYQSKRRIKETRVDT